MSGCRLAAWVAGFLALMALAAPSALAGGPSFVLYTGYADCPIEPSEGCGSTTKVTNPAFPSPWFGGKGVQFVAQEGLVNPALTSDPDTSGILIANIGKTPLSVEDVLAAGCSGGLDPWGTFPYQYPYTVPKKGKIVFSATSSGHFDGSETCGVDTTVTVRINGTTRSFTDSIANSGAGALHGNPSPADEGTPWAKISPGKSKVTVLPAKLKKAKVGTAYTQRMFADGQTVLRPSRPRPSRPE